MSCVQALKGLHTPTVKNSLNKLYIIDKGVRLEFMAEVKFELGTFAYISSYCPTPTIIHAVK